MKRAIFFLLIAALLCLPACSGGSGDSAQQGLIPPVMSTGPYSPDLVGAAGAAPRNTVIELCSGASENDTAAFAAEVFRLVNIERVNAGQWELFYNDQLASAAQEHSIDMACNQFLSHYGSDGSTVYDRIVNAGYFYSYAGENVAWGYVTPADVVAGWMASQAHRDAILNWRYGEAGVGYVYKGNDTTHHYYYWTLVFGTP